MVNAKEIEDLLREDPGIKANSVSVEDTSHKSSHANHKHFFVRVSSEKFKGLSLVEQHQKVYQCLKDLMQREIHALKIRTEAC